MSTAPAPPVRPVAAAGSEAAAAVATELAGRAGVLERDGVRREDLQALAGLGLLAVYGPPELGGAPPSVQREVAELLAGASPDAWFVWFQHGPVVRMLDLSPNEDLRARHLAALCRGELLGGVAWSHLRTPRPSVFATRVDGSRGAPAGASPTSCSPGRCAARATRWCSAWCPAATGRSCAAPAS